MLAQLKNMFLSKILNQLNHHGIKMNEEKLQEIIEKSPLVVAKIQAILLRGSVKDRATKLATLLSEVSGEEIRSEQERVAVNDAIMTKNQTEVSSNQSDLKPKEEIEASSTSNTEATNSNEQTKNDTDKSE